MARGPNPGGGLAEDKILNLKRPVKAVDITAGIIAHKKNLAVQCWWHHQEKVNHTPETHIPSPNLSSLSCHCCCDQFPFGGPCRGHNILSAMAAMIVRNSVTQSQPKVACNTYNGNSHNDYVEFPQWSQSARCRATHTMAMAATIMQNFHMTATKATQHTMAMAATIMQNFHTMATKATQHTMATAATIMWNFHMTATKLAQHTTATAAMIVQNFHTMVPKLVQHMQWQQLQRLCGIFT